MLTTEQLQSYNRLLPKGAKSEIAARCGVTKALVGLVLSGKRGATATENHEAICRELVAYMERLRADNAVIEGTFTVKP